MIHYRKRLQDITDTLRAEVNNFILDSLTNVGQELGSFLNKYKFQLKNDKILRENREVFNTVSIISLLISCPYIVMLFLLYK